MSDTVIQVDNLGKRYALGQGRSQGPYRTLRESFADAVRAPWKRRGQSPARSAAEEEFWALRDVSFEIKRGEAVGIIGRNGAGKSTLLKILSRITEPTCGRIALRGRVASLLEVGTGFHPELTGRENIFLNGAILGMHRHEIRAKFDEIVAFAEVERFLDTPVKRYSSGMYVRLAFAVAAHLEPEILVVDEVLAVGDAQFQKRCLGKMQDVAQGGGRTVLFVSHNMATVRALCPTGILLRGGRIDCQGPIHEVIDAYTRTNRVAAAQESTAEFPQPGERCTVWMTSATLLCNDEPENVLHMGDRLGLLVRFRASKPITKPIIGALIRTVQGENVINANNYYQLSTDYPEGVTEGEILCDFGMVPFMANTYTISLWLCRDPQEQHHVEDAIEFEVEEKDIWGSSRLPPRGLSTLWWQTRFELR